MQQRSRTGATFAAGLGCGLAVSLMLAAGRADPSGEWASAATQHGDFVAIWKYQSFEGFTELIDVVDADAEIRQHLANEAAQMREQFGPDDLRTEAAEGRLFRHNNPTRSK